MKVWSCFDLDDPLLTLQDYVFLAQDAYDCLRTVPFDSEVGSQLIEYFKDLVQFQSTLAYLKNPPPSYQQPPVDLLASLDSISASIDAGVYHNEYEFEAALQSLIYAAHDGHLSLNAGVLAVFSFGSPKALGSISIDGVEIPKVYFTGPSKSWPPSTRLNL